MPDEKSFKVGDVVRIVKPGASPNMFDRWSTKVEPGERGVVSEVLDRDHEHEGTCPDCAAFDDETAYEVDIFKGGWDVYYASELELDAEAMNE